MAMRGSRSDGPRRSESADPRRPSVARRASPSCSAPRCSRCCPPWWNSRAQGVQVAIGHNIGYGRVGASRSDVVEASKAAQVHEFIHVALDTRAERAIQVQLDRIKHGRTTLVIAHRLSTIVEADPIVVMDKARIIEGGRHGCAAGQARPLYAQLWNLPLQPRESELLERRLARQPVNLAVLLAAATSTCRSRAATRSPTSRRSTRWRCARPSSARAALRGRAARAAARHAHDHRDAAAAAGGARDRAGCRAGRRARRPCRCCEAWA